MVTPKSSVLIGFSIINHPFWGSPIFGNTHILWWCLVVVDNNLKWSPSIPRSTPLIYKSLRSLDWFHSMVKLLPHDRKFSMPPRDSLAPVPWHQWCNPGRCGSSYHNLKFSGGFGAGGKIWSMFISFLDFSYHMFVFWLFFDHRDSFGTAQKKAEVPGVRILDPVFWGEQKPVFFCGVCRGPIQPRQQRFNLGLSCWSQGPVWSCCKLLRFCVWFLSVSSDFIVIEWHVLFHFFLKFKGGSGKTWRLGGLFETYLDLKKISLGSTWKAGNASQLGTSAWWGDFSNSTHFCWVFISCRALLKDTLMGDLTVPIQCIFTSWHRQTGKSSNHNDHAHVDLVRHDVLGGRFKSVWFAPLGKTSNLTSIFFRWVRSTTNYI